MTSAAFIDNRSIVAFLHLSTGSQLTHNFCLFRWKIHSPAFLDDSGVASLSTRPTMVSINLGGRLRGLRRNNSARLVLSSDSVLIVDTMAFYVCQVLVLSAQLRD